MPADLTSLGAHLDALEDFEQSLQTVLAHLDDLAREARELSKVPSTAAQRRLLRSLRHRANALQLPLSKLSPATSDLCEYVRQLSATPENNSPNPPLHPPQNR